jgi:hypothetical protein
VATRSEKTRRGKSTWVGITLRLAMDCRSESIALSVFYCNNVLHFVSAKCIMRNRNNVCIAIDTVGISNNIFHFGQISFLCLGGRRASD